MKLSNYAEKLGISYKTAWRMWKRGELDAYQLPSGTVVVKQNSSVSGVAIYARVSSSENKSNLESQAERLTQYALFTIILYSWRRRTRKTECLIRCLQESNYEVS